MRAQMLMVAVVAAWLTLASSAAAGDFECTVPWYSGSVKCGDLFSVRPGETVTIELLSVTDNDGKDATATVSFVFVDANTKKAVTQPLPAHAKGIIVYKNETKAEVIARLDTSYAGLTTVHLKARYTIAH